MNESIATGARDGCPGSGDGSIRRLLRSMGRLAPLALAAVVAWGCTGRAAAADFVRSQATQAPGNDAAAAEAAAAVNAFGFDLLHRTPAGNAVISPASVALALAMARAGAAGETASQMDTVLRGLWASGGGAGIASFDRTLNGLSSTFVDAAGKEQKIEVRVANASYAQRDLAFVQAYLDSLATAFDAEQRLADFRADPESARKAINWWVDERTNGRIPELLDSLSAATRLVLVNAVYLKAAWKHPFTLESTTDDPFTTSGGATVPVATMHRTFAPTPYASGPGWQAVELPYGDGSLAMDIVVPEDLAAFEAALDRALWAEITASFESLTVQLSLPRFETESKLQLGDVLAALGMPLAFDPDRADFSGMTTEERLFIAKVVHQANISVDEKGTEAAAATAVVMEATAAPSEPVVLDVDRPFLFAIRDTKSGAVVFLGRVVDPSAG